MLDDLETETFRTGLLVMFFTVFSYVLLAFPPVKDDGFAANALPRFMLPVLRNYYVWALSVVLAGLLLWVRLKLPSWHSSIHAAIEKTSWIESYLAPKGLHFLAIRFSFDEAGIGLTLITALANVPNVLKSMTLALLLKGTKFLGLIFRKMLPQGILIDIPKLIIYTILIGGTLAMGMFIFAYIVEGLWIVIALLVVSLVGALVLLSIPLLFLLPWLVRLVGYGSENLLQSAFIKWDIRAWPTGRNITRATFAIAKIIRQAGLWRSLKALLHGVTPHSLAYQHPNSLDTIVNWLRRREAEAMSWSEGFDVPWRQV